jgi:predicted outer membrane protein
VPYATQLRDGEIAYIYLQANQFDVEEAELGIARGTAPEVKQHGEMVAKDHSGVIAAFEGILMEHGIKPTAPSDNARLSNTTRRSLTLLGPGAAPTSTASTSPRRSSTIGRSLHW